MACRSVAGLDWKIWRASRSHWPIAVPPLARSPRSAFLASARVRSLAIAIDPSGGYTGQVVDVPATIANHVPSLTTSTAAAVAARASAILAGGKSIDPEQSMMMISALPPPPPPDGGGGASPLPSAVTVTIALTSFPLTGRYGLWSMSTVNPGGVVIALSWWGGLRSRG